MQYLYPCKPNRISPTCSFFLRLDQNTAWVAEVKRNGWRCLVERDGGVILWTRHKTLINEPLLTIREACLRIPEGTVLDGELIHSKRVKGAPDMLYLFDVVYYESKQVTGAPLVERRKVLEDVYNRTLSECPDIILAMQVQVGKRTLYSQSINDEINEGIVLKKLDSTYPVSERKCLQNPYWLKVKKDGQHLRTEVKNE